MRVIAPLFTIVLAVSLFTMGCSKSNPVSTDTVRLHDTTHVHDTTNTPLTGPAFIRFIVFLNNSQTVVLNRIAGSSSIPFTSAGSFTMRQYTPIRSDTSLDLTGTFYDSTKAYTSAPFRIPALGASTLVTIALFETAGPTLSLPVFGVDPHDQPPTGFGYLRLIDGCSDYPTPIPKVEAYLDALTTPPLFTDSTTHAPIFVAYQQMSPYVLVPVGAHHLLVKGTAGSSADYDLPLNVSDGQSYTARITGSRTLGTDRLYIDAE